MNIEISKGTDNTITVTFDIDGIAYTMLPTDKLIFNMKTRENFDNNISTITLNKEVTGTNIITLLPADTSSLKAGTYIYDITLHKTGGTIYKIVEPNKFIIKEVVSND